MEKKKKKLRTCIKRNRCLKLKSLRAHGLDTLCMSIRVRKIDEQGRRSTSNDLCDLREYDEPVCGNARVLSLPPPRRKLNTKKKITKIFFFFQKLIPPAYAYIRVGNYLCARGEGGERSEWGRLGACSITKCPRKQYCRLTRRGMILMVLYTHLCIQSSRPL